MKLAIIVAMAQNRVIGCANKLPWYLPEDLKHFKKVTIGSPIIMGRKTYESIGRILPGRKNIILTRQKNFKVEGAIVVSNLDEAISACGEVDRAFIIGGAEIYKEALPRAQELYLTLIHQDFEGDAKFPEIHLDRDFKIISKEDHEANDLKFSFVLAERIKA